MRGALRYEQEYSGRVVILIKSDARKVHVSGTGVRSQKMEILPTFVVVMMIGGTGLCRWKEMLELSAPWRIGDLRGGGEG